MSATLPYVEIQDLRFTANQLGGDITITYTNGAALVVSCADDKRAISIAIVSGTTTAAAIKAAVEAHTRANSLVTVTKTSAGTLTTAQVSCVNAPLAGGTAAVAASKMIGGMLFTAVTAGTAGNSITITFADGTLGIGVASSAITFTFPTGATKASAIQALYAASSAAKALVYMACPDPNDLPAYTAASSPVSLAGGAAAVAASKIVQDLTFSADAAGTAGNGATITYADGATAGSETVAVTGSAIAIGIQSGTSTATQIKTAFDASEAANGAKATGTMTVLDYAAGHLTAAAGSVVVNSYAPLHLTAASKAITFGTPAVATAAVAAHLDLGTIIFTALATGVGGNNLTVEYVADITGDQAVVEMTSATAILVHMDDTAVTGTTGNTIKAAVNADPEASLLVLVTGTDATVQAESAAAPLAGGAAAIAASTITVDGHTFTAVASAPGATEFAVVADLTALITALSAVDATDNGSVITVVAHTAGAAGNSIAVSKTGAGLTFTGATLAGGYDAATVTVAGHVLTESAEWTASADTATTAESLKDAIHALTEVNCTRTGSTCNIVAATAGVAGNSIALLVSDATNLTKSGAVLTGGVAASTVTVGATTLTESTNYTFSADNATSAESLKDAILALSGVTATRSGAIITIVSDSFGTAGNATALATSNVAVISKSGAFLAGGLAKWDCTVSGTGGTAQTTVNTAAMAGAVAVVTGSYFLDQTTALTSSYVAVTWGFQPNQLTITNDEATGVNKVVVGSWDGSNEAFSLLATESVTFTGLGRTGCYLKYGTAAPAYRVSAVA